jgi:hypothetical protein
MRGLEETVSVWFAIPSARPAHEVEDRLRLWRERGYKIALFCDVKRSHMPVAEILLIGEYLGYALAVNALVAEILCRDSDAAWVVTGGDDTDPDNSHMAREIAEECSKHFTGTFGVMQPTGDRWDGGCIDRICGSPWLGREFCERANQGRGPLWYEYTHMFVDEELQNVAIGLGILWQRPDLTHIHHHFCRVGDRVDWARGRQAMPEFLREANSLAHWEKFRALFQARRAAGFPGSEPLPA